MILLLTGRTEVSGLGLRKNEHRLDIVLSRRNRCCLFLEIREPAASKKLKNMLEEAGKSNAAQMDFTGTVPNIGDDGSRGFMEAEALRFILASGQSRSAS